MSIREKAILGIRSFVSILKGRIPGQLIIQYTDNCNATCPQCSMRRTEGYRRFRLANEEIRRIIDSAAGQNIQALSFTGGEPFIYEDELIELIQYASGRGIPLIRTGTNGYMFMDWESPYFEYKMHSFAEKLSRTKLRNFWISIDSADAQTHEQMRGLNGVIKGIEKALPIFHEHGIYPAANLGINRNTGGAGNISMKMSDKDEFYLEFKQAFELFYSFVIDLGFTMTNACYPMSAGGNEGMDFNAVYGAASDSSVVTFSKEEKIQLFKALMDTIPEFRPRIRIFTPLASLYSLIKQYEGCEEFALPCRGGIDFFFVRAKDGNTYPCGYRGNENLGKFYDLNVKSINRQPYCKECDWECFRDPSEQIGFFIEAIRNHTKINKEKDPDYKRLWKQDIIYYNQCDYFDGRKAKSF